jgi:hypothetical protein
VVEGSPTPQVPNPSTRGSVSQCTRLRSRHLRTKLRQTNLSPPCEPPSHEAVTYSKLMEDQGHFRPGEVMVRTKLAHLRKLKPAHSEIVDKDTQRAVLIDCSIFAPSSCLERPEAKTCIGTYNAK